MWPNRRSDYINNQYREMQEADRTQPQSSPTTPSPRDRYNSFDDEIETDDDAASLNESDAPVDLLLLTSLETCILSVPSGEMASTSCIAPSNPYPHIVYFPVVVERRPSPGRSSVEPLDEQPEDENLSDNSIDSASLSPYRSGSIITSECTGVTTQRALAGLNECQTKDLLKPQPAQAKLRLCSIKRMALPSSLATQVANRIIKFARCIRNPYEKDMCCLNCGLFPIRPVTGPCGHTRCTNCIKHASTCPCGKESLDTLSVNILIQDLIKKTCESQSSRIVSAVTKHDTSDDVSVGMLTNSSIPELLYDENHFGPVRLKHKQRASVTAPYPGRYHRIPMSPRARYNYALELVDLERYREAAPHLALAAASAQPDLSSARTLLAQVISMLSKNRDPRGLTRQINHLVRQLSSVSWIKPTDMECILCCETFANPVTTPCGHMFCRTCIERTLDYGKRCPLCVKPLHDFKLTEIRNTVFVQAALGSINAVNTPPPLEPDLIPIFVCTVAYPGIPCPLFIFDPRYWLMIRRVLESGSRRFGMVACDKGQKYSDFGTILKVCDCVHLEDGRSILSTVGLSRFKVIERGVRDGCEIARIVPVVDILSSDVMDVWELKLFASQTWMKGLFWLNRLDNKVLRDIEAAFGRMPMKHEGNEAWWESPDGPSWLWWLVAVLPLRSEIKVLILSTNCLFKRLMAVARTLDAVDRMTIAPTKCEISTTPSSNSQAIQ